MSTNTIITIERQYGSGGHLIGEKLAESLGIPFYDSELIKVAAKESGICEEIFESFDEKPTTSFLYSLVMDPYSLGYNSNAGISFLYDLISLQYLIVKPLFCNFFNFSGNFSSFQ